ncbi:MAG: uncharacterized protein K0Q93_2192 [Nocardioidaceae bacterium]|nr:uncharacterized protein [Nocardioidaceae bacterium]
MDDLNLGAVTYGDPVSAGENLDATAAAVTASSLAELSWVDDGGGPRVLGVVVLLRQNRPAVAFTYADEALARAVAAAGSVTLSLTEPRSTGADFRPLLARGRPLLVEDPDGDLYAADLLLQELRRYPPSRVYVDSPLLQRENWWYLPRLVVELDVQAVEPLRARESADDQLLVVAGGDGLDVHVARTPAAGRGRLALEVDGAPPSGPAVLFSQDASFPDLENWSQWSYRGAWDGAVFTVQEAPAAVGLGPPLGLRQRWRRHRDLERRCVAALSKRGGR